MADKLITVRDYDGVAYDIPESEQVNFEEWLLFREGERAGAHYNGPDFHAYRADYVR